MSPRMACRPSQSLASRLRCDGGLSIVEVLIASLLLVLGALTTLGLMDTAHRQTFRAEQSQVVSDRLQAEMEAVKRLEYTKVALTATPLHSTDSKSPNYRVANLGGSSTFALNENGTNLAPLVVNGTDSVTGGVVVAQSEFSSGDLGAGSEGDIEGRIHRYVTWINDPACPDSLCPGVKDFKRVTIAIQADEVASGGVRAYQQIQSDLVDGSVAQVKGATTPPAANAEAIPFTLSDTPCGPGSGTRVAPSSHAAHNTLGPCSAGAQTGATLGAPDRLFNAKRSPVPSSSTGSFDFSTDVLTQAPADEGLQMPVQPKQCEFAPSRSNAGVQVHRWVTAPVTGGDFVVDGSATLSLYSKTINNAVHTGKLCIWLFARQPTVSGGEADNLFNDLANGAPYFTYSSGQQNWNSGPDWGTGGSPYQIPLTFGEQRLQPGDRLGLAIAVDVAGTPGEALQFRYDHRTHDSVLQVYTTTKETAPD